MTRVLVVAALIVIAGCTREPQASAAAAQPSSKNPSELMAQAPTDRPDVKVDQATLITGDFDGDKLPDQAALGRMENGFVVVIDKNTGPGTFKRQILPFGINGSEQAATCGPITKLNVAPLSCAFQTDEVKLPGCIEAPGTIGLSVGGDDCDPINLYWDHDRNLMAWWRN